MHHYDMLSFESFDADPSPLLVVVGNDDRALRLRSGLHELGVCLVTSSAGILLHHHGQGVRHHPASHCSTHDAAHDAAHTASYTTANAACPTTHTACPTAHAACPGWAGRSIQLRSGCREHLGSSQEGVVLPHPPPWMPTHCAAALRASVAASNASDADGTSPSR